MAERLIEASQFVFPLVVRQLFVQLSVGNDFNLVRELTQRIKLL